MFEELLAGLATKLDEYHLPYMIIGGQAVLLYGEPRLTKDIDITLGVDVEHLDVVLQMVAELGLRPLPDDPSAFINQTMVLPCIQATIGIRLDFIFSFSPYERQALQRVNRIPILGVEVCFASPEDIIIHKIFAGRPRDIEDARSILVRNHTIDVDYINACLSEFDKAMDRAEFVGTFQGLLVDR